MSGVIQLQTEIPGPKSRALMARRAKAVPKGVPAVTPIFCSARQPRPSNIISNSKPPRGILAWRSRRTMRGLPPAA